MPSGESPRHATKLSENRFSSGAGYAAFAGWGPSWGPDPAGWRVFVKRPPRALRCLSLIPIITDYYRLLPARAPPA
eukprot:5900503-Pyramimonas_sp.AAC.1